MSVAAFLPVGDTGVTVEFGRTVDPEIHAKVMALDAALIVDPIPGVIEASPTYRSLFLQYDPTIIGWDDLRAALTARMSLESGQAVAAKRWIAPAVFAPEFGEDLAMVAEVKGMSQARLVEIFCAALYRVYMVGFVPGFTYLGGLPEALHLSRRVNPRLVVPAGSVSIGGVQAGMCPIDMPSGWHLLGKTPIRLFDLTRDQPCIFAPGDLVRFEAIDPAAFASLSARAASGDPIAQAAP